MKGARLSFQLLDPPSAQTWLSSLLTLVVTYPSGGRWYLFLRWRHADFPRSFVSPRDSRVLIRGFGDYRIWMFLDPVESGYGFSSDKALKRIQTNVIVENFLPDESIGVQNHKKYLVLNELEYSHVPVCRGHSRLREENLVCKWNERHLINIVYRDTEEDVFVITKCTTLKRKLVHTLTYDSSTFIMEDCEYSRTFDIVLPNNDQYASIEKYRINQRGCKGETWLFTALSRNCTDECISEILECGCSVNTPNFDGFMPLHLAVRRPTNVVTSMLIESNADINAQDRHGNTPLHYAVLSSRLANVEELLQQRHILYDFKNFEGISPLYYAITAIPCYPILITLLGRGCDPNLRHTVFQRTVLHRAVRAHAGNNIIHALIRNGADINARDKLGMTPFHYAVGCSSNEVIYMMLYYGANANQKSNDGRRPLELAMTGKRTEIAEYLMLYTDNFDDRNAIGWTLLHTAICYVPHLAFEMLENGADVNLTSNGQDCISLSLDSTYPTSELFEAIWARIDITSWIANRQHDSADSYRPILEIISHNTSLPNQQFLRCLYKVFESPYIDEIIEYDFDMHNDVCLLLHHIFARCGYNIDLYDRLKITYLFFYHNIEVYLEDVQHLYREYGINYYVELLLKHGVQYSWHREYVINFDPLFCIIWFNHFREIENIQGVFIETELQLEYRKYFRANFQYNLNEVEAYRPYAVTEVPSLLQLGRDAVRDIIYKKWSTTRHFKVYQIFDQLPVPANLKDILYLRKPLYTSH